MWSKTIAGWLASVVCLALLSMPVLASTQARSQTGDKVDALQQQIDAMQKEIDDLKKRQQAQVKKTKQEQKAKETDKPSDAGIKIGGAVRFQYAYRNFSATNKNQKGDFEFDTFRINLDGKIGDVILSAGWRWYDYMTTLHHAWVGYDFSAAQQIQAGLVRIPFGNQPFNSHSFFFSSDYYLGLEDTYAFGIEYVYNNHNWNIQLAGLKNSARGVGGNSENYSFDLVGVDLGSGSNGSSDGHNAGRANTAVARVTYTFKPVDGLSINAGFSGLYGGLYGSGKHGTGDGHLGNYRAYAVHTNINYQHWNVQFEALRYDYRFASHSKTMVLGAYAADYETPTSANAYTANVAYHLPVLWGPVTGLDFYNDVSWVDHKANGALGTYMNVTGVGIAAGGIYAYVDYINARNQPFIGGDFAGTANNQEHEQRVNVNVGYYF